MDQYERQITLQVVTKGKGAKRGLINQLNEVFHSANINIESGNGKEVNILYSFEYFHSDDHSHIESDKAMEVAIRKLVPGVKVRVSYAGVNRDNLDAVLQEYDLTSTETEKMKQRMAAEAESTERGLRQENLMTKEALESRTEENHELKANYASLEAKIIEERAKFESLEKSQSKSSDAPSFSDHLTPDELITLVVSASRQKVIDDHAEYAENTEALGYDNTLEYVIMLVENSGNLLDDKSKFFKRKILKADREANIFSSSEELREILIHYDLKKRDDTLENIYDSVKDREAAIEQNQQDEPEAVKEARKVLEVYEGLPPVIKEATKELHKISLGIVNDYTVQITDDDSEIKKEQVIDKGIIKLVENYSDLLKESEIMFSDVKKLINNKDGRSENDHLYYGTRFEGHSEEQTLPLPREVAESLGYTIEELISRNMTSLSSASEEGA